MTPKRKSDAEASANEPVSKRTRNTGTEATASASKEPSPKSSASASNAAPKSKSKQTFKYSNPDTLSKKPEYINLEWPNIEDFLDEENEDMPEDGQLIDSFCDRVSDLGLPISEEGAQLGEVKIDKEVEKRDQDHFGMHIYNDWTGWGMSECFINYLKEFNKDIFKKTISPYKKWAYVEGLATYFKSSEDMFHWLGNEDGDTVKEIAEKMGLMVLTAYSALAEHDLFKPDFEVKNIGIMSLLMLEFAQGQGQDLDLGWGCEIVRMCDEAGIDLDKEVRKQVSISKEDLKGLRDVYKNKDEGYKTAANIKSWKPENDVEDGEKKWYRWDWKSEFAAFAKDHKGGSHFDLTKGNKKDQKAYILGSKEFSERIGISDPESETESV